MINRKIDKAEWKQFFDFLSKQVEGTRAEIEVASLKLGDQFEAEWLPVIGLVYDHKDNSVEIALEASKRDVVDHIIREPREIYFAENGRQFMGLDIIDLKGTHHIVKAKCGAITGLYRVLHAAEGCTMMASYHKRQVGDVGVSV